MRGRRFCRLADGRVRKRPRLGWPGLAACAWLLVAGCAPSFEGLLEGADGVIIRLTDITRITGDSDLTEDDQREALRALGLTDESLIDLLVRGL